MTTALTRASAAALITRQETLDEHPAVVYLASLAPGSRRTMRQALDTIARIITGEQADALTLQWRALRYQHTAAILAWPRRNTRRRHSPVEQPLAASAPGVC